MVNYNPNAELYAGMSIEDLHKELAKPNLMTEDKSLIIHTIAGKRVSNAAPIDTKTATINKK